MAIVGEKRARAFSSIANLGWGLDVLGVCVTAAHDEVAARLTETQAEGGVTAIRISGEGAADIPAQAERNTAGLAVSALLREAGRREAVELDIVKGVRPGSGLGSSSASAAAAVVAVNELLALDLPAERLVKFAAEGEIASAGASHADNVAAAICGGFVIARPETPAQPLIVRKLPSPPAIRFAIATPDVVVTTSDGRRRLPDEIDLATYALGCAQVAMIVDAIRENDPQALGEAVEGSWVDRLRGDLIPGFDRARAAARSAGATGAMISGSGPTVAAVVPDDQVGARVAEAMRAAFAEEGVSAVTRVVAPAPGAHIVEARA